VPAADRQIWLCADDYGMSPAVSAGIRDLILRRRINATSVMMPSPHLSPDEIEALDTLNSGQKRAALGLHVTLTTPFKPMSESFAPLSRGKFPSLNKMFRTAVARRLDPARLMIEVATQLEAFIEAFGQPPDFVDGHQHVHLLPQVRDAVLKVVAETVPQAWVRQCGRSRGAMRLKDGKDLLLDVLSVGFRRKANQLGVLTNPAFAGAYDFTDKPGFAKVFPRFLEGLPDGGLVMCHPGFVDAELQQIDPVTHQRERELAFFNSEEFPRMLAQHGIALATPAQT